VLIGDQRWGLSKFLIVDDDPQRTSKALILGPHLRDSGYDDVLQRLVEGHGGRHDTAASLGLPLLLLDGGAVNSFAVLGSLAAIAVLASIALAIQ
jgi:hypothetical protein